MRKFVLGKWFGKVLIVVASALFYVPFAFVEDANEAAGYGGGMFVLLLVIGIVLNRLVKESLKENSLAEYAPPAEYASQIDAKRKTVGPHKLIRFH